MGGNLTPNLQMDTDAGANVSVVQKPTSASAHTFNLLPGVANRDLQFKVLSYFAPRD